jgi:hypothetical protein
MTNIPDITSPAVGLYLHDYVEWEINKEQYISKLDKLCSKDKQRDINYIILLGASIRELEFLFRVSIEEDPLAKKVLKKAMNIWKDKPI